MTATHLVGLLIAFVTRDEREKRFAGHAATIRERRVDAEVGGLRFEGNTRT